MRLQRILIKILCCVFPIKNSGEANPCISNDTNGHCYQIIDTNITWNEASSICKDNGGHLIIIESAEEQQFIADQIRKRNFTADALWLGSENVHAENKGEWVNGEKFSYVNWAKGEPDSPPIDENCAEIYTSNMKWNDRICTRYGGYVCEKTYKNSDNKPCMNDGQLQHCYQIVQTLNTWAQASNICRQDGGSLIAIESAAEQEFLEDQMHKMQFTVASLWLGSNNLHPEAGRKWANGKKITFVNWSEGEPNNTPYVENCAEIKTNDGEWNDEACSTLRGYICEKKVVPGSSHLQAWIIGVAVGSVLLLLGVVLFICCFIHKRKKYQKEKRAETYQDLQQMDIAKTEHVYNQRLHLSDAYCSVYEYTSGAV